MTRSADDPVVVDARGQRCPWPVLRAARAMREGAGSILVLADDPVARTDLPALALSRGWHCTIEEAGGIVRFNLSRGSLPS